MAGELKEQRWKKGALGYFRHGRVWKSFLQYIARFCFIPPGARTFLQSLRGVNFQDKKRVFLGFNVLLDELYPERIHIGKDVYITEGTKILTHYYDPAYREHTFTEGEIVIEDNVFIGYNTIIAGARRIGRGAVIGAGAVVTKDVEPGTIVGGIPARVIGARGEK